MGLFVIPVVLICAALPWITVAMVIAYRQEVRELRARIERLERGGAAIESGAAGEPHAAREPHTAMTRAATPAAAHASIGALVNRLT